MNIEIRAPATGTVVGLSVHTVGGVIAPGATVLEEIVPLDDRLIVEAQVQPNDIDDLGVG
jgi:multidrug resistance efflux pump